MRILCDTQIILWLMLGDPRLGSVIKQTLADQENEPLFSSVSLFEIALKIRVGKFAASVEAVDANCRAAGMTLLPIALPHVAALSRLVDTLHKDPFDLLLIAQAMAEDVPLLTADRVVQRYPIAILKA